MRPIRSRLARALAVAFLLTFSMQAGIALADDPIPGDPAGPPTDPVLAPTTPEDPGFGELISGAPENPADLVPTTPEDPGFGG